MIQRRKINIKDKRKECPVLEAELNFLKSKLTEKSVVFLLRTLIKDRYTYLFYLRLKRFYFILWPFYSESLLRRGLEGSEKSLFVQQNDTSDFISGIEVRH